MTSCCTATDVPKLPRAAPRLERTGQVCVSIADIRAQNGHSSFRTLSRDLRILRSGLYRRCSSGRAIAARTTWNVLPVYFVLPTPRTAEACYGSSLLLATASWTRCVIHGGAATPSVLTLPTTQSPEYDSRNGLGIVGFCFIWPDVQTAQTRVENGAHVARCRTHCEIVLLQWQNKGKTSEKR